MIDFKITFQAVELFYGNHEKMYLISKIIFRKFKITSLTKFKHSVLPRKRICHYGFGFLILNDPSSISSILLYQNRPNLSEVMLF